MPLEEDRQNISALTGLLAPDRLDAVLILMKGAHRHGLSKAAAMVRRAAAECVPDDCAEAIALRTVARQIELAARKIT